MGSLLWITSTHLWLVLVESVKNQALAAEDKMKLKKKKIQDLVAEKEEETNFAYVDA